MGVPASNAQAPAEELRPPSLGAIASREAIHFYLMAFARWNRFPMAAARDTIAAPRHYPEADVWTSEQGFRAMAAEYARISEFVRLARETGGEGWEAPNPARTFSPFEQKRRAIRFGLASSGPVRANTVKNKTTLRKR